MSVKEISRPALTEALLSRSPPIVFEALDKKYYDNGHIPTARVLPPAEIDPVLLLVPQDQALCCIAQARPARTASAAAHLEKQGYRNLAVYPGGKADWVEAGLRLEK